MSQNIEHKTDEGIDTSMDLPFWKKIFFQNTDEISEQLRIMSNSPLFDNIPKRSLKIIRNRCHVRNFKEDEHIFHEGEPGIGMYIIIDGEVEIYTKKHKNKIRLAYLTKGDFFGELGLFLTDLPRTASAIATKPSKLLGFFNPDLIILNKRSPNIANIFLFNIIKILGTRLLNTNTKLEEVLTKINLPKNTG